MDERQISNVNMLFKKIFPTTLNPYIFFAYVGLLVSHGLIIIASQNTHGTYAYNTITVVFLTDLLKLLVCLCLHFKTRERNRGKFLQKFHLLCLYFVPALLYCASNNLTFFNLSNYDPTTYYLLWQFRIVITAFLYQIFFQIKLTKTQWFSFVLLTLGCMIKQAQIPQSTDTYSLSGMINFLLSIEKFLYLLMQIIFSCLASVFTEFLLKNKTGIEMGLFMQNIFMHSNSILCSAVLLIIQSSTHEIFDLKSLMNVYVILIIAISAATGIITSIFMKVMDSILKTFATGLELIITAVLSFVIFGYEIQFNTVVSIFFVVIAIVIYYRNPISEQIKNKHLNQNEKCLQV